MPQIAHLAWGITVTCMVSFGDSKHEPVEPLHSLLDVTPLKLALSAKCTIHDVCAQHEHVHTLLKALKKCRKYKFLGINNSV